MGAPSVVVSLVLGQDQQQMPLAEDQHPVGNLGPGGEHEPFRIRVRMRAGGIFTASIPASARTASNDTVNCPDRSRTRNRKSAARSPRSIRRLRFRAVAPVALYRPTMIRHNLNAGNGTRLMLPRFDVEVRIDEINLELLRVIWIDEVAEGIGDNRLYGDVTGTDSDWSEVEPVIAVQVALLKAAESNAVDAADFERIVRKTIDEQCPGDDFHEGPLSAFAMLDGELWLQSRHCRQPVACRRRVATVIIGMGSRIPSYVFRQTNTVSP
jgi:hypothetical protein